LTHGNLSVHSTPSQWVKGDSADLGDWRYLVRRLLISVASALVLVAAAAAPARVAFGQAGQESGISVVGEGRVLTPPDLARVVIGVERFDPSLGQAMASAANDMGAVINRLVQLGVSREGIQTIRFAVSPVYENRGDSPGLRGYRVSNAVGATIRSVARVGPIIDAATAAGATRIEGVSFDSSRLAELKDQARELAMSHARAKAEQLARLAGASLGPVISIQESDTGGAPVARAAVTAAPAGVAPTPIEPGELQVSTVVRVTWGIR
jgi:uncharacterized protein